MSSTLFCPSQIRLISLLFRAIVAFLLHFCTSRIQKSLRILPPPAPPTCVASQLYHKMLQNFYVPPRTILCASILCFRLTTALPYDVQVKFHGSNSWRLVTCKYSAVFTLEIIYISENCLQITFSPSWAHYAPMWKAQEINVQSKRLCYWASVTSAQRVYDQGDERRHCVPCFVIRCFLRSNDTCFIEKAR